MPAARAHTTIRTHHKAAEIHAVRAAQCPAFVRVNLQPQTTQVFPRRFAARVG
jgi:hypothetical protein